MLLSQIQLVQIRNYIDKNLSLKRGLKYTISHANYSCSDDVYVYVPNNGKIGNYSIENVT